MSARPSVQQRMRSQCRWGEGEGEGEGRGEGEVQLRDPGQGPGTGDRITRVPRGRKGRSRMFLCWGGVCESGVAGHMESTGEGWGPVEQAPGHGGAYSQRSEALA